VKHTGDGAEGLRLATGESFDAIVLDHRLGPITGVEVLRSFRRNSQRTPVVLFSADWTIENDSDEIRALGAITMSKLSDFESLERLVSSVRAPHHRDHLFHAIVITHSTAS
jgi:DNA-binding response OmpR family regulator